jgi:hypothetical protein
MAVLFPMLQPKAWGAIILSAYPIDECQSRERREKSTSTGPWQQRSKTVTHNHGKSLS